MPNKYIGCFWNVQRFFDVSGGPIARSLGVTRRNNWNEAAYKEKLKNVCAVLSKIAENNEIAFVAFSEIESKKIVDDIKNKLDWSYLENIDNYSLDEGLDGNDLALLYSKKIFYKRPGSVKSISMNNRFSSRDILKVELHLRRSKQPVQLYIIHWPSRVIAEGENLRIAQSYSLKKLIDSTLQFRREDLTTTSGAVEMPHSDVLQKKWETPLFVIGDFNDEPYNHSVQHMLNTNKISSSVSKNYKLSRGAINKADTYLNKKIKLYNPSWTLINSDEPKGTYYREGSWRIYDQLLLSHGAIHSLSPFRFVPGSLEIFKNNAIQYGGKVVNMASRNGLPKGFSTKDRKGVSDHFPIVFEIWDWN